jgi:hypothetical protein
LRYHRITRILLFVQFLARRLRLLVLLAAESAAVVAVHRLGARAPFDLPLTELEPWLRAAPADALAAALRLAALAVAWWLLAATALYAGACVVGSRGNGRFARTARELSARVTPRAIRVAVDRTLVTSVAVGALLVPAGARAVAADDPSPRVIVDVRDGRDPGSITSLPAETPGVSPVAPPPLPPSAVVETVRIVVVAEGDNLWSLSADAVARATGRPRGALDDDEIARYWVTVCDANRPTLRSGDVNLIYPGEVVVLPPVH